MNRSEKVWNRLVGGFDANAGSFERNHRLSLDLAKKYLHGGDAVLDFGCATGTVDFEIAAGVKEVHGIDFSARMIEIARQKAQEHKNANVRFSHLTLYDASLAGESYDAVLAFNILHLLDDAPQAVRRIHALLKAGGMFVSVTACTRSATLTPLINTLVSLLGKTGLIPNVRFMSFTDLEHTLSREHFRILETQCLPFNHGSGLQPAEHKSTVFGYFIAAKKES